MLISRRSLLSTLLALSICVFLPKESFAQSEYFTSTDTNKNCSSSGCHTASPPPTCNGCHGHGTHATSQKNSMNLSAGTDKASYVVGDDIVVTLRGGYQPMAMGWVRVNVYDKKGVLLVSNSTECPHNAATYTQCDLPVKLKVRAQANMTDLYVAWMGNGYDSASAAVGIDVTSTIGVGKRAVSPAGHVEEIILTDPFTVTAESPSSGGGVLDWSLISGLFGVAFLRRKMQRKQF